MCLGYYENVVHHQWPAYHSFGKNFLPEHREHSLFAKAHPFVGLQI